MLQQSLPEPFKEWLNEQSMLRAELPGKDSLIEEQRKEIEVHKFVDVHIAIFVS